MLTGQLTAYRARWVVPVDHSPIEHGVLVVSQGRIIAVADDWPQPAIDLGDVALIPGLVNCHTHLEFSSLATPLTPLLPFTDWIRAVIRYRQTQPQAAAAAIAAGLAESLQSGVTLLGDIATTGWDWHDYRTLPQHPQVIVFQELLGLSDERVVEQMQRAIQHLGAGLRTGTVTAGLSPHAPYSTHPDLFTHALEHAAPSATPVAVHLAETAAEVELLATGTGEFQEFLESLGLWRPELFGGRRPRDWLHELTELPRALVVHGNFLTLEELALLAQSPHVTLVYCPRTHAAFGHPPHPWQTLLELGGSVALGTDSRASNPDLSLWRELQFLAERHPELSHQRLLQLGTLHGARALGRRADCGSLTPGKRADAVAITLTDTATTAAELDRWLMSPGNQVTSTMLAGEWVTGAFTQ